MVKKTLSKEEAINLIDQLVHSIRSQDNKKRNKRLTDREKSVLTLVLKGKSYSEVADKLSESSEKIYEDNAVKSTMFKIIKELKAAFAAVGLPDDINKSNLQSSLERYQSKQEIRRSLYHEQFSTFSRTTFSLDDASKATIEAYLSHWKASGYVYSAPAAVFFCGEHAVVYGYPGIHFPLPMRLYVQIVENLSYNVMSIEAFVARDPRTGQIHNVKHIDDYGRNSAQNHEKNLDDLYKSVICNFLKPIHDQSQYGFTIRVLSEFPLACGLNSSGALAASLASALVEHYLDLERFKQYFAITEEKPNQTLQLLSWLIENCFHNNRSSGIGAITSLLGRKGRHPLVYISAKRSNLPHRVAEGWNPINLGEGEEAVQNLLPISTVLLDPSDQIDGIKAFPDPPPFNLTLVYSGNVKKTEQMLSDEALLRYNTHNGKPMHYINSRFFSIFSADEIQRPMYVLNHEIVRRILLNNELSVLEKGRQLDQAYTELLADALGGLSTTAINSVVTDWKRLPALMNTYQSLLFNYGASDMKTEALILRLGSASMDYQLHHGQGTPQMGIKVTGSGGGGDLILLSLLEKEAHTQILRENLDTDYIFHFDSTQLDHESWQELVEGARRES